MTAVPIKTIAPNEKHKRFKAALDQAIFQGGLDLTAQEILALLSQYVGMVIALQDQRITTPDMAMTIVQHNLEAGNQLAIAGIGVPQGRA